MEKFGGVGLKNMLVIALFTIVFIVMSKVILAKYPVKGLSEVVHAV